METYLNIKGFKNSDGKDILAECGEGYSLQQIKKYLKENLVRILDVDLMCVQKNKNIFRVRVTFDSVLK